MQSTTLQLAAPAAASNSTCTKYNCGKHPQARVVGVCSACLAHKLSSLINYTSPAPAPEDLVSCRVPSPLSNSPPVSIISPVQYLHHPHQVDHLQTIKEEADSTTQEITNERSTPFTAVEICAEALGLADVGNNSLQHSNNIINDQISSTFDVVPPIEEEKPNVNHDISSISEVVPSVTEEVRITDPAEGKSKANPYLRANQPIKCKRSKSLNGLRGESLVKYESAANAKGEQSNSGAEKITLLTLFQLDDEEKWRNRTLMAANTSESELGLHEFSADYRPNEAEFDRGSIGDAKPTEEATMVHDNHTDNSHRCVPSASTSVCPSIPCKFKHSVLLNSLLCRKTGDEKKGSDSVRSPSKVHEASNSIFTRSFHEGGLTQGRDAGGFIRATYIASESRDALRRCRSKIERSVARSSVSSSQPASPSYVSHGVDMKSERKFNLTARAHAAEFPSIFCSSAETAEAMVMIPSKIEDSSGSAIQIEDLKGVQDLWVRTHDDSVAVAADIPASLPAATLQSPKEDDKPVIQLVSSNRHQAQSIPNAAEIGKAAEKGPQDDGVMEQQAEIPLLKHTILGTPTVSVPSSVQPWAVDTAVASADDYVEEVHDKRSRADTVEEGAAGCRNGIPAYITATESVSVSQGVPMAVCGRALSCSSSSGKAAGQQQSIHKVPEECKNGGGGVWEAYSNKSGKGGGRKWGASSSSSSSSSRPVNMAPDQSGLLRFYLTPLRGSGRARCSSSRRPPTKRHFWSPVFV